ncbi:MAG: hypothetical protein CMQ19_03855 [Gammaproteobacteria bacterium]|jgi:hypothetical protein|nr:hypothetical protein [Gammaproteobacteria bacterium]|tara:strand:- start:132 stop:350 length:219 start_codon:yes stop_codon:yes gene_type:complete
MKSIIVLLLILAGGVAMSVSADNGVLALKPDELRQLELESIPPLAFASAGKEYYPPTLTGMRGSHTVDDKHD